MLDPYRVSKWCNGCRNRKRSIDGWERSKVERRVLVGNGFHGFAEEIVGEAVEITSPQVLSISFAISF